jgi:hypothetical protein
MDATIRDGRSETVRELYRATFGTILNTLQEDRDLLAAQAFDIADGLSQHLDQYDGELDQYSFLLWELSILEPASRFIVLTSKYRKLIRYRIHQELASSMVDVALSEEDALQEVHLLIFQLIDSLTKRGAARLPTRLSALIRRHCGFIHKKRSNRARIVAEAGESIGSRGVAILTAAELASQRFDQTDGEDGYYRSETVKQASWGYRSA